MCKLSTKLKLCSCKTEDVTSLPHYWVLHKRTGTEQQIVGEAMLPIPLEKEIEAYNIKTLRQMLNDGNCFDVELQHEDGDELELHFSYRPQPGKYLLLPCHGNYLVYDFVFKNGKWRKTVHDPFHENLVVKQAGKITDPIMFS